ncbi:sigma-70 family RNA polymerase sigma factor [Sphingobacterium sp. InxBP1]|uniref:RNA polymerase sigma factor n=1 Tax=Sphingobacterium sp. InxBP1 TaxID=2870328 RepID=UPI0022432D1F|nr:sigma-70 family RNA polymerase sigma factor [Sphingobacterium sp. InxBP1]MCW8313044.1 sigma-70 family RNA polymerase sigma factor [Sphingobacterium sp. InxBP1]
MKAEDIIWTSDDFDRFQAGDSIIFEKVYNCYYKTLLSKVFKFCSQLEDAEEIVQETFIRLYQHRQALSEPAAIFPFLFTASKHLTITFFRKKVVKAKYLESLGKDWTDVSISFQQQMENYDIQQLIMNVLEELPAQQKLIFIKNKIDNHSYQEISDLYGLKKNTVRNHIALASKFVRFKLEKLLFILFLIKSFF